MKPTRARLLGKLALILGLSLGAAGAAMGSTLAESDLPGGFSASYAAPTAIGTGVTTITGTLQAHVYDYFVFTGLPAGAQTLTFDFAVPTVPGRNFVANGGVNYSTAPFTGRNAGVKFANIKLSTRILTDQVTLTLDQAFTGPLYLAVYLNVGAGVPYQISAPSNAIATPVPLPAGGVLLLSGLGGLWMRRRRAA